MKEKEKKKIRTIESEVESNEISQPYLNGQLSYVSVSLGLPLLLFRWLVWL